LECGFGRENGNWPVSFKVKVKVKINVKQSLYGPGQALRVPEGWGYYIS
jgi:hypothetical protein